MSSPRWNDLTLVVEHPVVADRLTRLRDVRTSNADFRRLVAELSGHIAYEALCDLETVDGPIDTPVSSAVSAPRVAESVLLVPILRAGLGMIPAVQEFLPLSDVAHLGLRRNEETLEPDVYLDRLPADLSQRRVVVCDPMLATGGSLAAACSLVRARGASRITALCLIASAPGLAHFRAEHPDIGVACAAVDAELDDRGYILPGLGDAGDRLFGPPD